MAKKAPGMTYIPGTEAEATKLRTELDREKGNKSCDPERLVDLKYYRDQLAQAVKRALGDNWMFDETYDSMFNRVLELEKGDKPNHPESHRPFSKIGPTATGDGPNGGFVTFVR